LADRPAHIVTTGTAQLGLNFREFLESFRVHDGAGLHLDNGPRARHGLKHHTLLLREIFCRLNEIGDEIAPALMLV